MYGADEACLNREREREKKDGGKVLEEMERDKRIGRECGWCFFCVSYYTA